MKSYGIDDVPLPFGRAKIYEEIRNGRLKTCMVGGRRIITPNQLHDYYALIEREAAERAGNSGGGKPALAA
jgi:hypothetical protein